MTLPIRQPSHSRAVATGRGAAEVGAALAGRDVPITAQQLFIELRESGNRLGIATIYRALRELQDLQQVHGFAGPEGTAFRACSAAPHFHVVCTSCGRVQEQPISTLADWAASLVPEGFDARSYSIEIDGICDRCADSRSKPGPQATS